MVDALAASDRPRRAGSDRLMAALAALAVLALAVGGADRSRQAERAHRASDDRDALVELTVGVAGDLERLMAAIGTAAASVAEVGPGAATGARTTASIPGVTGVGFLPADVSAPTVGTVPGSAQDRADPDLAALLDRTRDTGQAALLLPDEPGPADPLLVLSAAYAAGARPGAPRAASDRRNRLVGWTVASVDLPTLVAAHLSPGAVGAVSPLGAPPALAPGLVDRLPHQSALVGDQHLVVVAGDPTEVGIDGWTVTFAAAGLATSAGVAVAVAAVGRRTRQQREALVRSTAQVSLIGEVAPLVQQSLDLGEVLPEVAVQLRDHFGLAGVRLSTGASSADQTELFSLGVRTATPPAPSLRVPERVDAGDTITLALQRGGRSVALLELVAGRSLDRSDLQSLSAITELVAAAVVNASLYASEQAAVRRLRDLDAMKTVFLSTASHELRTPATAINGFATLLSESWDRFPDDQRRDFVERIAANSRSLGAVVQDLLDFSLLDRGAVALAVGPVDLPSLVGGVVDRLAPVFPDHTVTCAATASPPVAGDVNGLERVVTNLLTNAAKFSPPGSTITVTVEPSRGGAAVVVSDQGPGVPLEERQRVFARFFRGSGEAVVQTRGVGIGLSVVAELVDRMGGAVSVDDAPGGGARFTVWLAGADTVGSVTEDADAASS